MAPKKNPAVEEMEDIRRALDFLSQDIETIKTKQDKILKLVEEVTQLRIQIEERDKKISELERKVEDLEQYSRINDVIVTGLKIKPRSYAHAVNAGSEDEPRDLEVSSAEQQVAAFLASRDIHLDVGSIEACHPLPRKKDNNTPAVILRFVNRKNKIAVMKQGKKLKGTNVYLNDHLTKRNADIAKKARYLRKQNKIQNTWVMNCKIYIRLNGSPEEAKVLVVKDIEDLKKYE
ncbi:hypothetical protein DPX16_23339 [Anabarilius grahami]|uniref:Uncharacterized protein n=1 Tax=Anabarilius grahami TaxID=495550 RepID=A0A3N0Y0Z9_ANAGA|nr:hypothetical protein DPX16_23339 [Anabarilius grahami]